MTAATSAHDRPLAGRRVLVTRPREQAAELVSQLTTLGAEPIVVPLIRIEPPADPRPLHDAAAAARDFDAIVFTSRNAVDSFVHALPGDGDPHALDGPLLCAVGPGTAAQLTAHGFHASLVPDDFRAERLLEALVARGLVTGARVLVPRADIGRDVVTEGLRAAGAHVTDVVAYRTVADDSVLGEGGPDIARMLRDGEIDVVTFTSGSAVTSFAHLFGTEQATEILARTVVATIGPVTSAAARELGIEVHVQAPASTLPALVQAISEHLAAPTRRKGVLFK